MTADRDRAVSRALATLPVPEHGPGFWDRLEAAITTVTVATETARRPAARPGGDAAVPELAPAVPGGRGRRRPRRWPVLGAVAAAVAGLVLAAGLMTGDGGDVRTVAPADRGDEPAAIAPPPAGPGRWDDIAELAGRAVDEWLQAVAAGDEERAWRLLGPQSQKYLGRRQFAEMFPAMAEGSYARWPKVPDRQVSAMILPPPAGATYAVVTYSGTIELEGEPEYRIDAFPVRLLDGRGSVEQYAFGPGDTDADFITPSPGENGLSGIGPDAVIEVDARVPGDAYISLDGLAPERMVPAQNVRGRWRYVPEGGLETRTHQITVITVAQDWFTAISTTFLVEG